MRNDWLGGSHRGAMSKLMAMVVVATITACATGGVGSVERTSWREDMGRLTQSTLQAGIQKIFRKHAVRVGRQESTARDLYYESVWEPREVMATEEVNGVTNARNRIVLRGRRVQSDMGGGLFRVTWELQNEVTSKTASDWHPGAVPDEVRERYRPVFSDLVLETRTGVRRQ